MKGFIVALTTCAVSSGGAGMLALFGPAAESWVTPAALMVLAVPVLTVELAVLLLSTRPDGSE